MQAVCDQLIGNCTREAKAFTIFDVSCRDMERKTAGVVKVPVFPAVEGPGLKKFISDAVMMDGNKQISLQGDRPVHAHLQTGVWRRHHKMCRAESGSDEFLLDARGEFNIEFIFRHAAGAGCSEITRDEKHALVSWNFCDMPYVQSNDQRFGRL